MNFISCYVFKILDISSLVSAKMSVALLNTAIVLVVKPYMMYFSLGALPGLHRPWVPVPAPPRKKNAD